MASETGTTDTRTAETAASGGNPRSPLRPVATVPGVVWGPLAVGSLMLAVGLIGLATGQPLLFPSLGPTAYLQAETPKQPSSRFYNTLVGHMIGLGAGVAAVLLLGAANSPGVMSSHELVPLRVWAAVLSAVLAMLGMALLKASHPPAAATMLLVALGGMKPTWQTAGTVLAGVLILAVLGEWVRYLRMHVFVPPEPSKV